MDLHPGSPVVSAKDIYFRVVYEHCSYLADRKQDFYKQNGFSQFPHDLFQGAEYIWIYKEVLILISEPVISLGKQSIQLGTRKLKPRGRLYEQKLKNNTARTWTWTQISIQRMMTSGGEWKGLSELLWRFFIHIVQETRDKIALGSCIYFF